MRTAFRTWTIGAAAALLALPAAAQESTNRVAANTDWSVFVEEASGDKPKECWAVSAPKESVKISTCSSVMDTQLVTPNTRSIWYVRIQNSAG